jgi:predicted phosphodiesterase
MSESIAFLGDLHGPKCDLRALENTLECLYRENIGSVVLLGDIVDFDSVASYDKDPKAIMRLEDELDYVKKKILEPINEELEILAYLEGNHETRLARFMKKKAPELFGTLPPMAQLLGLTPSLYLTEHQPFKVNRHMLATHGTIARKWSGWSVKQLVQEKFKKSVIMGHTHRMGTYYESGWGDRAWVGVENGHMMNPKLADYVLSPNWQAGFHVVTPHPGGYFQVEPAHIFKHRVYFRGQVVG